MIRKTKGFTMIELLVFIALGSIVFIYFSSIFGDFYIARNRSNRLEDVYNSTAVAFNTLIQDSRWSVSKEIRGSGALQDLELENIVNGNTETVVYRVDSDGILLRNNVPMTDSEVEVLGFKVKNYWHSDADKTPLLEIEMQIEHRETKPRIFLQETMVISLREKEIEINL